jgi:hypothetical protein
MIFADSEALINPSAHFESSVSNTGPGDYRCQSGTNRGCHRNSCRRGNGGCSNESLTGFGRPMMVHMLGKVRPTTIGQFGKGPFRCFRQMFAMLGYFRRFLSV